MRKELFLNPRLLLERLAEESIRRRRFAKLKNSPAAELEEGQMDSMEFFEIICEEKKPEVIFDLGANLGSWTLLAKTFFPDAVIHAFEPIKIYQEAFTKYTNRYKNIFLHKVGVGEKDMKTTINFAGHSSSFLEISKALIKSYPDEYKRGEQEVEMVSLDNYVQKYSLPFPDLMKLDVEGYELEALKGATNCMNHCKYLILEISFTAQHVKQPLFHDVVYFLAQRNFTIHSFPIKTSMGNRLSTLDVLFERADPVK